VIIKKNFFEHSKSRNGVQSKFLRSKTLEKKFQVSKNGIIRVLRDSLDRMSQIYVDHKFFSVPLCI